MEFKFAPTEEFSWEREYDDGSRVHVATYYPGNVYNCSRSPVHDALREMCKSWQAAGKITVYPLAPGQSMTLMSVAPPAASVDPDVTP